MNEETAAIVPAAQVHLGSLAIRDPKDLVHKATMMADSLAAIINQQNLFKNINGRKYVMVEGWTTLGAMMGIVPVEEYCRPLPVDSDGLVTGFEAKVKLIRAGDGGMVGAASAECTYDEGNWKDRDSYALRSMSITRATGKAYRLSFSWIMKLAGFEATPAEEMDGTQSNGSVESAKAVADRKIAEHKAKSATVTAPPKTAQKPVAAPANGKNGHEAPDNATVVLELIGEGQIALSGKGLAIVKSEMNADDRAYFNIRFHPKNGKTTMKADLADKFRDMCRRLDVGTTVMGNLPSTRGPHAPEKASIPPFTSPGKSDSTDPIVMECVRVEKPGKKPFLDVTWDGRHHSSFDKGMWGQLETAKGLPVMLETKKNGNYSNIVRMLRCDGIDFTDDQNQTESGEAELGY